MKKIPPDKLDVSIIAFDLDDTLLKHDLTISDKSVEIIQEAAQRGIYIVLASGRTDNAILPYIRRLDIAGTQQGRFMITQNGSSIFDLHLRQSIYSKKLSSDILQFVYTEAQKMNLGCHVYDESTVYVPFENKWTDIEISLSSLNLEVKKDYVAFLQQDHPKMVIPGEPDEIAKLEKIVRDTIGDRAVIFTSKPYFLEIMAANAGKGEALEYLCTHLNLDHSKTMAFGDAFNDESMIRYAAFGTAMLNGRNEIKDLAKFITEFTNDEGGAPLFVEKYVL